MEVFITKDAERSDGPRGGQIDVWPMSAQPSYREDLGGWYHAEGAIVRNLTEDELSEKLRRRQGGKDGWPAKISISFG